MSYDLQAEGLNGVNVQTSIIAGHDWEPNVEEGGGSPVSTVLFVSGIALDNPSPANVDAMIGRGRLFGNGLTGFGGDKGGTGVIGVAGGVVPADGGVGPVTGQNAGVYGTGVAGMVSTPAVGVIGQGGPGTHGVEGRAGSGIADGVRGFASGTFSGVAGFGDLRAAVPGFMARAPVRALKVCAASVGWGMIPGQQILVRGLWARRARQCLRRRRAREWSPGGCRGLWGWRPGFRARSVRPGCMGRVAKAMPMASRDGVAAVSRV